MKKVFKWLGIALTVFVFIILAGVGYLKFMLPNVGDAPDLKVEITQERVERGKYLANSVTVCMDCHSKRDWSQWAGPLVPGTNGGGGEPFDRKMGFPGDFYSKNITPYGLKDWTDGQVYRAITTGVNKDNEPLFPVMPYHYYGQMDTEDVYSIIAYIRTLPSINNDVPKADPDFPFSLIMHTIPHKAAPSPKPDPSDSVAYGGYLVKISGCVECHSKFNEKQQMIAGTEFGGGRQFPMSGGTLTTPNITPDATGLGYWSKEKFIAAFKKYQDSAYVSPKLAITDFNTLMPWVMYSAMTESDLSSMYQYLKTVKPISNEVTKFAPKNAVASR
ncbi:MAG TPA: cytochrome C [Flavipsychrobacter sp.]|nr:cytochrome C [Flavipsychrobacter sp.]